MKRNFGIAFVLLFAAAAIIFLTPSNGQATTEQEVPTLEEMPACPPGVITIQGCIVEDAGCIYVNTINGRTIYVNLSSVSVGDGDVASLTGQFVTDADCAPCVLNVTSATDLGDC